MGLEKTIKPSTRSIKLANNTQTKISRNIMVVKTSTLLIGVMSFLMILPDDAFKWLSIYNSITPSSISYKWLNYSFGILQLVILFIGLLYSIKLKKRWLLALSLVMFIREGFFFFLSDNNIFNASAYEMYLTFYVGYAFVVWAEGGLRRREKCELYFKWFLVFNMLTLYIDFAMGGTGGILEGRYHSSNLDAGGTGMVCVLCIIYLFFSSEKNWYEYIFILLSGLGLLLSGSRANLIFLFLLLGLYIIFNMFSRFRSEDEGREKNKLLKRFIGAVIMFIFIIVLGTVYSSSIESWLLSSRFESLFNIQGLSSDSSILGRTASLTAGSDVLKSHPFGISGYFVNLQREVRMRGYPTFPHSTLLSMYLLFGPVVLIIYGLWISMLTKLRKHNARYFLIIVYFIISTIIYGSPITNFKISFVFGMSTLLAHWTLRDADLVENIDKE